MWWFPIEPLYVARKSCPNHPGSPVPCSAEHLEVLVEEPVIVLVETICNWRKANFVVCSMNFCSFGQQPQHEQFVNRQQQKQGEGVFSYHFVVVAVVWVPQPSMYHS